jgi:hypothetical protein
VLAERQTWGLFGAGGQVIGTGFVDLDAACPHDPKRRTWRRLLGKNVPKPLHLARDEDGRIHTLLATSDAARALRETGHRFAVPKVPTAPPRISDEALKERRAQERREAQAGRAIVNDALASVVARVEAQEPTVAFWRLVTEALAAGSWHDTIVDTVKRRGWAAKGTRGEELLLKQAAQLGPAQLRGVVVELLVSKHAQDTFTGKVGRMLRRACEVFGVDLGRIQAKHRAAVRKEKKGKSKRDRGKRRKT